MAALTVGQRADPLPLPGEQLAAHLAGASSIWHPVSEGQGASNFVWLRKNFTLPGGPEPTVGTVTVTATQSPLCRPPCEPHGGSVCSHTPGGGDVHFDSQSKWLSECFQQNISSKASWGLQALYKWSPRRHGPGAEFGVSK